MVVVDFDARTLCLTLLWQGCPHLARWPIAHTASVLQQVLFAAWMESRLGSQVSTISLRSALQHNLLSSPTA